MKKLAQKLNFLIAATGMFLCTTTSFAQNVAPQALNLQGRLIKPDGTPVEATSVEFQLQIRSPGTENCILFEETHTLNMSATDGVFTIKLGSGTRVGTNFKDTSALKEVFDNSRGVISSLTCDSGNTYDPNSSDARKLRVSFNDGTGIQTLAQDQMISAVPYSLYADSLQGKAASDLVQTVSALEATPGTTQSRFNRIIDTDWAGLDSLLLGTSSLYAKATPSAAVSNNGQRFTNVADPTAAQDAATKNYADTRIGGAPADASIGVLLPADAGKAITWDGTKWVATTPSTADNTKVAKAGDTMTGNLNFTGANTRINMNASAGASSILQESTAATSYITQQRANAGSTIVNNNDYLGSWGTYGYDGAAFQTATVIRSEVDGTPSAGDMPGRITFSTTPDGSATPLERMRITNSGNVGIGTTAPASKFTVAGEITAGNGTNAVPAYSFSGDTDTGLFSYGADILGFSVGGTTRLIINNNNISGIATGGPNLKVAGMGASGPAYSFAGQTDTGMFMPAAGEIGFSTSGSERVRIGTLGNVGIGTATPGAPLDVKGAIRMSGSTSGYVGFQPAAAAGSTVWTLPATDGAANQVLKTDGAGVLSWLTPAAGVTIGTTAGTAMGADAVPNCTGAQKLQMSLGPTFAWSCTTDSVTDTTKVAKAGDTMTGTLNLPANGLVAGTDQLVLAGGNVGIGVTAPTRLLDIRQNTPATPAQVWLSGSSDGNQYSQLVFGDNASSHGWSIGHMVSNHNFLLGNYDGTQYNNVLQLQENRGISTGAYANLVQAPADSLIVSGSIGIGTSTPGATLDVKGAVRISGATSGHSGFQVPAAAGSTVYTLPAAPVAGNVLSTDATGNLTWIAAGGGGTGDFKADGTVPMTGTFVMTDPDVAHGMTSLGIPTDLYGKVASLSGTKGGLDLAGFNDDGTSPGIQVMGVLGSNTPTASVPAIRLYSFKKNGTGITSLGASETVLEVGNGGASSLRVMGSGNVGIGTTAPNGKLDVKGSIVMSGATSGYVGFQPAAAAGSTVWTLPTSDGTANQVLQTDGTGILSWATPATGGISALTGDVTASGSGSVAATVAKVNGVAYPASPVVNTVPVVSSANTITYQTVPVAAGGTGTSSLTSGSLLVGAGTSDVTTLAAGTAGNILYASGASTWASGTPDTAGLVDKSSTQTVSGSKTFSGASYFTNFLQLSAQNAARFADSDSSNFVALRAPATVSSDFTLTLPATAGAVGEALKTDGAGNLTWGTAGIQAPVTLTATLGAGCSTIGQLAKSATGDLMVCDDSPAILSGADCSAIGVGALTFDENGDLYACLD